MKDKSIDFRPINPHDIASLNSFMNQLSRETPYLNFHGEHIPLTKTEQLISALARDPKSGSFLALKGDIIIGMALLLPDRLYKERHKAAIMVAVGKLQRGQGIGGALMDELLAMAKQRGFTMLTLRVYASNTPAINLYHTRGFVEYGRLPEGILNHHSGAYEDQIYMYKNIPD